ncbi:BamA/TamA family outer membrane protein [Pontibacter sp. CAU 1760]
MQLRVLLILLFSWLFGTVQAQTCEGPLVMLGTVSFSGNEITKGQVLQQELTFNRGDTVSAEALPVLLEENRKRLLNLRLFHQVRHTSTCANGVVHVQYAVQERFYLYPVPILDFADRNFNAWLEKKDWSRIDYGAGLSRRNFRGRNEEVRVRVQRGFNKRLEFSYRVPYLSRRHKIGAEVGVADYRSRVTSYDNFNNRQLFLEQESELPIRRTAVTAGMTHRQDVQRQEGVRLTYQRDRISDSVALLNPRYFNNGVTDRQLLRPEIYKVINLRNNFAYPLSGSYFEVAAAQTFFLQHSGSTYTTLRAKYVQYNRLSEKYSYMIGGEAQTRLAQTYAFSDNIGLGFRSLVRGYELYVIGGQHYGLFKQGLTRELLDLQRFKLKFIRNPKFNTIPLSIYLNAFTDAGYVVDKTFEDSNPLANSLLLGGGVGVHAVTFYDIVLRLEYSLNKDGNRGFYFSTRFPF